MAKKAHKLTDRKGGTIAKAEPPEKGQRFIFDDHRDAPRGFGLRITEAGGKAFILKYAFEGRQRRLTIGQWPDWSLVAARERARELVRLIDSGTDPLEAGRQRRSEPTVQEAARDFIDRYATGLASAKAIAGYFERDVIPALGDRKLSDITRRDLIELIEDKAEKTPTAARHLLAYLKVFFEWCLNRELVQLSPAAGIKPKAIVVKGRKNVLKPTPRSRVLDDDELRDFWQSADNTMHPLTALALKLVLVTGARPGEVAGMHADEIKGDVWTIPAARRGKTESPHTIGLPGLALDLIEKARAEVDRLSKRRGTKPSGYVFETVPGQPLAVDALSKAVARSRAELGNKDRPEWGNWTPHDLRRTARTGLGECGVPDEIGERVVGHVPEAMVKTYNTGQYIAEKKQALELWERRLTAILDNRPTDNVVPIWGRAAGD